MNLTTALHTTPFEAALGLIGARANGESDGRPEGPLRAGETRDAPSEPADLGLDAASDGVLLRPAYVLDVRRETRVNPATGRSRSVVVVPFVASTEDIDSHDSILTADWAEEGRLEDYKRNPVILWMHDRTFGTPRPAIGTAENVRVENRKLMLDVVCDDTSEFDREIAEKLAKGVLRAGSVGFAPGDCEVIELENRDIIRFFKNKLREFSICNIGSNPFSLSQGQRSLVKMARDLARSRGGHVAMDEVVTLFRSQRSSRTASHPPAPAAPPTHPTPAAPPRATKEQTMKTLKLDARAHRAANGTTAACPACNEAMAVQLDNLPEDNERAVADLTSRATAAEAKAAEVEARLALITSEKDAAEKRAASLESRTAAAEAALKVHRDATIAAEIDKRIGTRMEPAERADEVEIAERLLADTTPDPDKPGHTLGEKKWAARLAKIDARRDLGLLGPAITGGGEQGTQNSGAAPSQSRSIVDEINARAAG